MLAEVLLKEAVDCSFKHKRIVNGNHSAVGLSIPAGHSVGNQDYDTNEEPLNHHGKSSAIVTRLLRVDSRWRNAAEDLDKLLRKVGVDGPGRSFWCQFREVVLSQENF